MGLHRSVQQEATSTANQRRYGKSRKAGRIMVTSDLPMTVSILGEEVDMIVSHLRDIVDVALSDLPEGT